MRAHAVLNHEILFSCFHNLLDHKTDPQATHTLTAVYMLLILKVNKEENVLIDKNDKQHYKINIRLHTFKYSDNFQVRNPVSLCLLSITVYN